MSKRSGSPHAADTPNESCNAKSMRLYDVKDSQSDSNIDFDEVRFTNDFIDRYCADFQSSSAKSDALDRSTFADVLRKYHEHRRILEGNDPKVQIPGNLLPLFGELIFSRITDFRTKRNLLLVCRAFNQQMQQSPAWRHVHTIVVTRQNYYREREHGDNEDLMHLKPTFTDADNETPPGPYSGRGNVLVLPCIFDKHDLPNSYLKKFEQQVLPLVGLCTQIHTLIIDLVCDNRYPDGDDVTVLQSLISHVTLKPTLTLMKTLKTVELRLDAPLPPPLISSFMSLFAKATNANLDLLLDHPCHTAHNTGKVETILQLFTLPRLRAFAVSHRDWFSKPLLAADDVASCLTTHATPTLKRLQFSDPLGDNNDCLLQILNSPTIRSNIETVGVSVHDVHNFVNNGLEDPAKFACLQELELECDQWNPTNLNGAQFIDIFTQLAKCPQLRLLKLFSCVDSIKLTIPEFTFAIYQFCSTAKREQIKVMGRLNFTVNDGYSALPELMTMLTDALTLRFGHPVLFLGDVDQWQRARKKVIEVQTDCFLKLRSLWAV